MGAAIMDNPFDVQTPENLSTEDMSDLFVSANTDFRQIEKSGHTFITGPRGAGKSMFFRFLEPDCQCRDRGVALSELDYYAAYVPIKETDLNLPELVRLQESKHAAIVLNEHAFIVHIATKIFVSILNRAPIANDDQRVAEEFEGFIENTLRKLLRRSGWTEDLPSCSKLSHFNQQVQYVVNLFDEIFSQLNSYTRRLAFVSGVLPYNGALFGYSDFLAPLIKELMALSFMPDGPLFLLIDDSDNLNEAQAMVLNSWVARRTTGYLCLKISAQEGEYKTYRAVGGQRIDAPHDYSEFNISDNYTTKSDNYKVRISEIIERRLKKYGIDVKPTEFFPSNEKQETQIQERGEKLKADWHLKKRGFRPGDDALRYARPDYMKMLSTGNRKSGSTYSYAGFDQLVHLSSGIVRHFLEAASIMFGEATARSEGKPLLFIQDSIQNNVVKDYSDRFLFAEFKKMEREEGNPNQSLDDPGKLRNLIYALGGMFRQILLSDSSERRVFSIAFSNGPDEEVERVLNLGVKYGYFHRSTIGNKEGTGRVPLFIMTRRLAPTFKLDPTSFAGYKFVTNDKVKDALHYPKKLVESVKIKGFDQVMSDDTQRSLFEDE